MLYPPKKRAYSPEPNKTKDLANLPNINSKFTGTGGSIFHFIQKIDLEDGTRTLRLSFTFANLFRRDQRGRITIQIFSFPRCG